MFIDKEKEPVKDRIFRVFAQTFQYGYSLFVFVLVQFLAIEISISFTEVLSKTNEALFYNSALRFLLMFAGFFYGCCHVACRSYVSCKQHQVEGASKYRKRATINFFVGLALFLIALGMLLLAPYVRLLFL